MDDRVRATERSAAQGEVSPLALGRAYHRAGRGLEAYMLYLAAARGGAALDDGWEGAGVAPGLDQRRALEELSGWRCGLRVATAARPGRAPLEPAGGGDDDDRWAWQTPLEARRGDPRPVLALHANGRLGDRRLWIVRQLPSLVHLNLEGCRGVRGGGLVHLAALRWLEELALGGSGTADAGLAQVAACSALRVLRLGAPDGRGLAIGDEGLRHLLALRSLEVVDLRHCYGLSDRGLALLDALPALRAVLRPAAWQVRGR